MSNNIQSVISTTHIHIKNAICYILLKQKRKKQKNLGIYLVIVNYEIPRPEIINILLVITTCDVTNPPDFHNLLFSPSYYILRWQQPYFFLSIMLQCLLRQRFLTCGPRRLEEIMFAVKTERENE